MDHDLRDPVHLRALPPVAGLPRWDRNSPEFRGFCADILENGIKHPLLVTRHNGVVDGELRRQAAVAIRLGEVPCLEVEDGEVNGVFLRELVRRRNLTKGQRAFLVAPFLQDAFNESLLRRSRNASKTKTIESFSFSSNKSAAEWAAEMGFSHDLLNQARRLHEIFSKREDLKKLFRDRILDLDDPIGLGAALAGCGGADVKQDNRERGILCKALAGFVKSRDFWNRLTKEERAGYESRWRETAQDLPRDMRATIARAMGDKP